MVMLDTFSIVTQWLFRGYTAEFPGAVATASDILTPKRVETVKEIL